MRLFPLPNMQASIRSKSNPRCVSTESTKASSGHDEDEIVILSDTVRQRRSRTPSTHADVPIVPSSSSISVTTSSPTDTNTSQSNDLTNSNPILPDVLPDTFRLAESSTLFSHVSDPVFKVPAPTLPSILKKRPVDSNIQEATRVEVRESDLSRREHISMPYSSAHVNTISILESVDTFEPEFVEMVNIVDASEDDDIEDESDKTPRPNDNETTAHAVKERDLLRDSEEPPAKVAKSRNRNSLLPNLKEILLRNSFNGSDKDAEETLVFSEDEDIPRFSREMTECADSDASDTVCVIKRIFWGLVKCLLYIW